MATLKEFEEALRSQGMRQALAILEGLRKRDRESRTVTPARRVTGQKMTPELAQRIRDLHATTSMTQQEIAFKVGVNQGRVNEVIKRGKWLDGDPSSPEARARDKAVAKIKTRTRGPSPLHKRPEQKRAERSLKPAQPNGEALADGRRQLSFADLQ